MATQEYVNSILLVEDNQGDAVLLRATLEGAAAARFAIDTADSMQAALEAVARKFFDVILLDLSLPDSHGVQSIRRLNEAAGQSAIVVVTGLGDDDVALSAIRHGAQDYLVKGRVDPDLMARAIQYAMDRKAAEVALQKAHDELEAKVRQRTADIALINQALQMLSACNKAIVRAANEAELLADLCQIILKIGGYRMAWVGFAENDAAKTVRPVCSVGFEDGYLESAKITWADEPAGRGPTGTCIRTGRMKIGGDFAGDAELAPWREAAAQRGYRSSIAMPLTWGGSTFGALMIYSPEPHAFDEAKTAILQELANDLAYGLVSLRTRSALHESQQRLKQLVHSAPVVIWALNTGGVCTLAEGKLEPLGLTGQQMVGRHVGEIMGDRRDIMEHVQRATAGEEVAAEVAFRGLLFESRYSPLRDERGEIRGVLCISTDITQRRSAEREVLEATERERRRIGQDLHDSIQGNLVGVGMMISALASGLRSGSCPPEKAPSRIENIGDLVLDVLQQTRGLARGLCPMDLKGEGLARALSQLAGTTSGLFRVPCEFVSDSAPLIQDEATAIHIYYICLEAVNNALKHAKPRKITIRLETAGDGIAVSVEDDGVGLPQDYQDMAGMGLATIGYRAKAIGAICDIHRSEDGGTVVSCHLPGAVSSPGTVSSPGRNTL